MASPVDSRSGWKDWCEAGNLKYSFDKWSKFKLKDEARILTIDSYHDFQKALLSYSQKEYGMRFLDWEKIMNDYDAVYLTDNGNFECHLPSRLSLDYSTFFSEDLYSWDVESIVILNYNIIDIIENS